MGMGNFHEAKVEKVSYRGGRFGCPRLYLVLYRKYDDTRAVSYTHLDVYKRQDLEQAVQFAESLGCTLSG